MPIRYGPRAEAASKSVGGVSEKSARRCCGARRTRQAGQPLKIATRSKRRRRSPRRLAISDVIVDGTRRREDIYAVLDVVGEPSYLGSPKDHLGSASRWAPDRHARGARCRVAVTSLTVGVPYAA